MLITLVMYTKRGNVTITKIISDLRDAIVKEGCSLRI